MLGQAKGHVGPSEAGEKVPHLQYSESAVAPNLVGDVELLKGLRVHIGEGLVERGEGGDKGKSRYKPVRGMEEVQLFHDTIMGEKQGAAADSRGNNRIRGFLE